MFARMVFQFILVFSAFSNAIAAISPPDNPAAQPTTRQVLRELNQRLFSGVLYGNTPRSEACTANVNIDLLAKNMQVTLFRAQDLTAEQTTALPARNVFEFSLADDQQLFSLKKITKDRFVYFALAEKRTLSGPVLRSLEVRLNSDGVLSSVRVADGKDPSRQLTCIFNKD